MFDIKKFGAYISALRKKADMTQSQLADKLHLTRQAVSKYERGLSFPDISVLTVIAEMFYTTLDNLIYAGNPTENEAEIILSGLPEEIDGIKYTADIINIAPLLNINHRALEKMSEKFLTQGIDISNILEFSKSITEKDLNNLSELSSKKTYDSVDEELLGKLIPVMNNNARMDIIAKIFDGEVHYRVIEKLVSCEKNSEDFERYLFSELLPLIEEAIMYGVLEGDILEMIWGNYKNEEN